MRGRNSMSEWNLSLSSSSVCTRDVSIVDKSREILTSSVETARSRTKETNHAEQQHSTHAYWTSCCNVF